MNTQIHAKLLNALTTYDRKQSTRKGYNRFALAHYCGALSRTRDMIETGQTLRAALLANFNGRLLSIALKAVGEPDFTRDEQR